MHIYTYIYILYIYYVYRERKRNHCGKVEKYTCIKENCLKMVSGQTPTGTINYREIGRNANLKNSKGMS